LNVDVDAGEETLWGVSVAWQKFFNTGLLGAIIHDYRHLSHGSLWRRPSPRLLVNPFTYIFLASVSFWSYWYLLWGLGSRLGQQDVAGYQRDEVYIGTAERAVRTTHADNDSSTWDLDIPRKLPVLLRHLFCGKHEV
jgi:hypothetical protein